MILKKIRLDQILFDRKLAESKTKAQSMIMAGQVSVEGKIINKSGSWFSYEGTKLGQGRDAVKSLLIDNPDLMEKLEKQIVEAIS